MIIVAATIKVYEFRTKGARHNGWLEGAVWARAETSPEAVFAITDAGLFGYFSDRRSICLDGKANGYAYQAAVHKNEVKDYMRRVDVDYVADIDVRYGGGVHRIGIPRAGQSPAILVVREAEEVYRSGSYLVRAGRFGKPAVVSFAIWKWLNRGDIGER